LARVRRNGAQDGGRSIQHTALTTLIDRRGIRRVDYYTDKWEKKKFSRIWLPSIPRTGDDQHLRPHPASHLALCLAAPAAEAAEIKELSKFELKITARPSATFRNSPHVVKILITRNPDSSFGKSGWKA